MKQTIIDWIDADREAIVAFVQTLVRARSPNPPGDTRAAMAPIRRLLDDAGLDHAIHAVTPETPNLVAAFDAAPGGRHLVLNGHIDVFPVEGEEGWRRPPWSGDIADGAMFGRGVADMKAGTAASVLTYAYLARLRERLAGRLTLTVVSDEETLGPNGARHLFDICPEAVTGTACLNGEPSGPETVRFGEKGSCWLRFTVNTPGGHGAYTHVSANAADEAIALIAALRGFAEHPFQEPPAVAKALDAAKAVFDAAYGPGAAQVARFPTMSVGVMTAGPKVNMIASTCTFEVDFRLPIGMKSGDLLAWIETLRARHRFGLEVLNINEPNWISPDNDLAQAVKVNALAVTGVTPADVASLGNTDARLWRYRGVPAVVYGPRPRGMGGVDEHVPVEEIISVIKVHALSAYDYLDRQMQ